MIQKRTTAAGVVRWIVRWRDPSRREHSRTFDTRREAKAYEAEITRRRATGQSTAPAADPTVLEVIDQWLAATPLRISTRRRAAWTKRQMLGPWGEWPGGAITPADAKTWWTQLTTGRPWIPKDTGVTPVSAASAWSIVRSAFTWARREGITAATPIKRIPRPAWRAVDPVDIPTLQEIREVIGRLRAGGVTYTLAGRKLVTRPHPIYGEFLEVAALTGMRAAEIAGLAVGDVDLPGGVIHVRAQLSADTPPRRVEPKTRAGARDVPISAELAEVLRSRIAGRDPRAYVFARRSGEPIRGGVVQTWVKRAAGDDCARVHLHAMRHYFASALLTEGIPIQDVGRVLGHSSPVVTLAVYAHVLEGSAERISAAISAAIGCGISAGRPALKIVGGGGELQES